MWWQKQGENKKTIWGFGLPAAEKKDSGVGAEEVNVYVKQE